MTLNEIELVIAGVVAAVGVFTLLKALAEYRRQGVQKRAEQFFELRRRMKDNDTFRRFRKLTEREGVLEGQVRDLEGQVRKAEAKAKSDPLAAKQLAMASEELKRVSAELRGVDFEDKRDYLGLFQELALVVNSRPRLIKPQVAQYMFGYYAIRCSHSKAFMTGVKRDSASWSLFFDFVDQMEDVRERFLTPPGRWFRRPLFRFRRSGSRKPPSTPQPAFTFKRSAFRL